MTERVNLSVVVITKNEQDRLADCLQSVSWADDIVVVDDFSTDKTLEVARRFTDRVYTRRMEIEGKHRNYAYALAKNEWVLSLDADERVTPQLRDELTALLKSGPKLNGYTIPRKNHIGRTWLRYGGQYPSAQLRFFKRGAFTYDEQAEVHPRALMSGDSGRIQGDILHYTYRDFSDAIAKLDRQTDLEAKKWFREKRKVGIVGTLRKTVDRFWRAYFKKKGHKDGVPGLFLAVLSGMYQFLSFAKYWEMKKNARA